MLGLHLHVWPVCFAIQAEIEKDEKERRENPIIRFPQKNQIRADIRNNVEVASAVALFLNRKKRKITCMSLTLARQFEREKERETAATTEVPSALDRPNHPMA